MTTALKREELKTTWEIIRNGKPVQGAEAKLAEIAKFDLKTAKGCVGVLDKVAKNCSFEEFYDFVERSEIPAVKLTPSEMEAIKGGCFSPGPSLINIIKGIITKTIFA